MEQENYWASLDTEVHQGPDHLRDAESANSRVKELEEVCYYTTQDIEH